MTLKIEKQVPVLFAKYIFINDIPTFSEDAKKFLKSENIKTLSDLSKKSQLEFDFIYERKVREEIKRFHRNLLGITAKKEVLVKFSKNISAPKTKKVTREEENILTALLIYENLLGKKRQVKKIKQHYLPNLYLNLKKIKPRRLNRNTKLFRIQYFSTAS